MKLTYKIKENDSYNNIKELLKAYFKISDRLLIKLKKNKKIMLNSNMYAIINSEKVKNKVSRVKEVKKWK